MTPPFLQMPAGQTSQSGPVRMVPVRQSQEQSLRTRAQTEQVVPGHWRGLAGLMEAKPPASMLREPCAILKKPLSPQAGPHEFWQSQ